MGDLLVGEERGLRLIFLEPAHSRGRVGVYLVVGGLWSLILAEEASSGMRVLWVAVVCEGGRGLSGVSLCGCVDRLE